MRIDCECGFSGSIREQETPLGIIGRCFGCGTLYEYNTNNERVEVMTEPPKFKDLEDMQKFLAKATAGKDNTKTPTGSKPKRKRHKPAEKDSSNKLLDEKPDIPTYKTIHFYLRPGDSWDQLLKDGREEVGYSGPGTLVFCHQHFHSEDCSDSCRRMQ